MMWTPEFDYENVMLWQNICYSNGASDFESVVSSIVYSSKKSVAEVVQLCAGFSFLIMPVKYSCEDSEHRERWSFVSIWEKFEFVVMFMSITMFQWKITRSFNDLSEAIDATVLWF